MNFKMPGKVYRTAMSSLATSHMLIAAGTEDVQVRLCDIASGAFTHTLSGHRGMLIVHTLIIPFNSCACSLRFLFGKQGRSQGREEANDPWPAIGYGRLIFLTL